DRPVAQREEVVDPERVGEHGDRGLLNARRVCGVVIKDSALEQVGADELEEIHREKIRCMHAPVEARVRYDGIELPPTVPYQPAPGVVELDLYLGVVQEPGDLRVFG